MKKFILPILILILINAVLPVFAATNIRYSSAAARSHYAVPKTSTTGYNARGQYISPSARTHQIKYGYASNGRYVSSSSKTINGMNSKGVYVPVSENANVIKYGYDSNGKIQAVQVAVNDADEDEE